MAGTYPKGAYFILVGYLLERFTYYGIFGGAVFYFQRVLEFDSATSSIIKSSLEGLIYFAPILGAILADTYLGKARTVFTMCCIYTVGTSIFMLSSIPPFMVNTDAKRSAGIMGILIMGLAAGLMKAVYSSLGADQFDLPKQRDMQKRYFYAFYWMINCGAFIGTMMTAQLRDSTQCFGGDCYLLPFAILTGMIVLSTTVFFTGRSHYKEAPPDDTLLRVVKCIFYAGKKSLSFNREPVDHWIHRAKGKFDDGLIADVKKTLGVLLLFSTFPIFWALFYQNGTVMVFQAKRLNDEVGGARMPPEVSSAFNPLFVLILIPLFDFGIYPLLKKLNIMQKVTTRMFVGMMFAVASFIIYSVLNLQLEQNVLDSTLSKVHIYNTRTCNASVMLPNGTMETIMVGDRFEIPEVETSEDFKLKLSKTCDEMEELPIMLKGGYETSIFINQDGPKVLTPTMHYLKDVDAEAKVRVLVDRMTGVSHVQLVYGSQIENFTIAVDGSSEFQRLSPQLYEIKIDDKVYGEIKVKQDGVYEAFVEPEGTQSFFMTEPSHIHMLVMLLQYLIITIGEVLFSISGMDFAYTEAPQSMKSTLTAANLFTITIGLWILSIIKAIITAAGIFVYQPSYEGFLFACLMFANSLLFLFLIRRYKSNEDVDEVVTKPDQKMSNYSAAYNNKAFSSD